MDQLTVIVVGDETAPVRRFRVPRLVVRRGVWALAASLLFLLLGTIDWVSLRVDAVEVERLRDESMLHQGALEDLTAQVDSLREEFERLRDFERKVRIIADLPRASATGSEPEAQPQPPIESSGREARPGGRGGEAEPTPLGALELEFDFEGLAGLRSDAAILSRSVAQQVERLEDLIGGLEGKSKRLAATPSIWPTRGWVTSRYGYRTSPFTGRRQFHSGIDIAADFGTIVVAPARAKVSFVGRKGALGKSVILDHGYGTKTTFGHTAETFVERGQVIERGARIAAVGSTGRSTGPHLHYALSVNGKSVNPADYILE